MARKRNNPFITIGDIPSEYFCDRVKETESIIRTLTNESNLVLMSPRRMGKSKLIQHCFKQPQISEQYYTFYIDLLQTSSLRELTYAFGKAVFDQLKTRGEKATLSLVHALRSLAGTFGFDSLSGMPTFTLEMGRIAQPEFTLQEIFGWLEQAEKPCIVCFDEFQKVNRYTDNRDGRVEALLRSHIQHLAGVNFIFSGSERHLLAEMFYSQAKPFYNSASQLNLKALDLDVYQEFASHWYEAYDKRINKDAIIPFYEKLEGTTYYLQKLMHESFADTLPGEICDSEKLQNAFDNMIEEARETYQKQLGSLSERTKEVLYAIAREGHAQKIMSIAFIKRYALASPSVVQTAVKNLIDAEIVTLQEGVYTVSDVLFALYLRKMLQ